ncbi:MAG TPA: alkaline phosphatase family protein [Candidatus Baltobacteraceae bacterium]|nr:alkaline phosphatase family protein [Candidatus Baltobacteraceae bacterium]
MKRSRVQAIAATAVAAAAMALAACNSSNTTPVTPVTPKAKIGHVIVLFQENRSFNNLFAGFPGATTAMSGHCATHFPNASPAPWCTGSNVPLRQITLETRGKPAYGIDIAHDHAAYELEYDGGKMDGFNLITFGTGGGQGYAKLYPYAFVERSEIKPYWDLATTYALADNMFSTATTDSFVAHQQIIAGTTQLNSHESVVDTPSGPVWGCDAPAGTSTSVITTAGKVIVNGGPFPCFTQYKTMADVLDAANVSWKYYVYGNPFISSGPNTDFSGAVWNAYDAIAKVRCAHFKAPENCSGYAADWKTHVSEPSDNVLSDIAKATLPQMSWVIPGLLCSDHPASGDNKGPSWVSEVINAVGKSKYWNDTAILVMWDDWGGYYDPVAPPQPTYATLGMRVPLIIVSPYARSGYVSHTQYDFGSILKFVEQTFGAASLGASDASAASISDSFDFSQKMRSFTPVAAPYQKPHCSSSGAARQVIENDGGVPE